LTNQAKKIIFNSFDVQKVEIIRNLGLKKSIFYCSGVFNVKISAKLSSEKYHEKGEIYPDFVIVLVLSYLII